MLLLRGDLLVVNEVPVALTRRQVLPVDGDRLRHGSRRLCRRRRVEVLLQRRVHLRLAPRRQLALLRLTRRRPSLLTAVLPRAVALAPGRREIERLLVLRALLRPVGFVHEHRAGVGVFLQHLLESLVHARHLLAHVLVQLRRLLDERALTVLLQRTRRVVRHLVVLLEVHRGHPRNEGELGGLLPDLLLILV